MKNKSAGDRLRELFELKGWHELPQAKVAEYWQKHPPSANQDTGQNTISRWLHERKQAFSPKIMQRLKVPLEKAGLNPEYLNDPSQPQMLDAVPKAQEELEEDAIKLRDKLIATMERNHELELENLRLKMEREKLLRERERETST